MTDPLRPVFVERRAYRRRRLMDAARLLPFVGAVLILAPVVLRPEGRAMTTAPTLIYLFAVWFGLIVGAALIARRLDDEDRGAD
ncbi:MAG: hypothetical protein D6688_14130 [Alphaproteobacteria bacterium]|nr:MAG: hypothetical protein D6688_14130 [Alphaproteobacteria bacterium]